MIQRWYRRYRQWAHDGFSGRGYRSKYLALAIGVGAVGLALLRAVLGAWPEGDQWIVYATPPLGLIAAFDAWGAARYRGKHLEGWIRAGVILLIFAGLTLFFHKAANL